MVQDDVDASADSLSFVGSNIVARGNVVVRYKEFRVEADKAIVNISSKDIEAIGNVSFISRAESGEKVTLKKYLKMKSLQDKRVEIDGFAVNPVGEQLLRVKIYENNHVFRAEKAVGNLSSGAFEFKDFSGKTEVYFCKGKYATRNPDGEIVITDAKLTTCEYCEDDHEHYSVNAGTIKLFPKNKDIPGTGVAGMTTDSGKYSVWAYNCVYEAGGVPIFWFPVAYSPSDEEGINPFDEVRAGKDSDWGYFLLLSKKFKLFDYPDTTTKFMLDFYSERGIAVGNETVIRTEKTYTELFGYGLNDRNPYGAEDSGNNTVRDETDRITIPKNRYDLRLSHMDHITPRLDFRGQIEKLSDINFLNDFFKERGYNDPQPPTFTSLEYQFDKFSAALFVRPRVNTFFSEVERLPELRFDIPRQELFYNVYYQGESSISNLYMKWREYDKDRTAGNGVDPSNYNTWRIDSLHMFYYPITLDWLNLIPRAGGRLTYYSRSSDQSITSENLGTMFYVDSPDGQPEGDVVNYDSDGGNVWRFAGEIGLEANTKIYRSWQSAKNAFWQLDGLRHVMVPYMNYTFIPDPTTNRNHIYYFDDIDRIDNQNFVRLGVRNRLQTRRGDFGEEEIYNWLSVENYIDYHFQKESGFKNLGDFGTIITFIPTDKLTITSVLLIDAGQSSDHDAEAMRGNPAYAAGRPGISSKWINKWQNSITYNFTDDLKVYMSYCYQDAYAQQSAYSMGSTLTDIDSSTGFNRYYSRTQTVSFGCEFPIPVDDKTFAACEMYYDFEVGYMREVKGKLIRRLHCWEAALELGQEINRDYNGGKQYKNTIMFSIYLTALPSVKLSQRGGVGGGGDGS